MIPLPLDLSVHPIARTDIGYKYTGIYHTTDLYVYVFQDSEGAFMIPQTVEVESMQYIVVYDSDTTCLHGLGKAFYFCCC